MKHKVTQDELNAHLREQIAFLRASADAFDRGFEGEAKRLATSVRVLVHDTGVSQSLLTQLKIKSSLRYEDTADPINPNNLLPTPGLVLLRVTTGPNGGGEYVAPLGELLGSNRQNPPAQFKDWWERPVTKDPSGVLISRKDYVLWVSNKSGGSHVDPELPSAYGDLINENSLGWHYVTSDAPDKPFDRNPALASVRQIAYEIEKTLSEQVPLLERP
jgi:hypothetical protein